MFTDWPTQIVLFPITVADGKADILANVVPAALVQPLTVMVTL